MVKVVLTKDVDNLGRAGELKDVSPGYMRNFLVPQQMAVLATSSELKSLEARRSQIAKAQQKQRTEAEGLAAKLADIALTFQVRVGEQNRLYGSITTKDIADELARTAGITIDRRDIDLPEALKTLGTFSVPVKLGHDVKGAFNVTLEEAASA
ncbi:MAG: ribosomal protein [Chloroflexi bacterium]|nr:ribosomal protein [Chloroflexota bacterium]MDB5077515.1 ribosomal protein [Chloroflexota bacterium]